MDCCYNDQYTPGAQNVPQCFYPANAEIDAYFQTILNAEGMLPTPFATDIGCCHTLWLISAILNGFAFVAQMNVLSLLRLIDAYASHYFQSKRVPSLMCRISRHPRLYKPFRGV